MPGPLSVATVLLLLVATGCVAVLRWDAHERRLRLRVAAVMPAAAAPPIRVPTAGVSPLLVRPHGNRLTAALFWLLRYMPDAPAANPIPWQVVLAAGCVIGVGASFLARFSFSMPTSLLLGLGGAVLSIRAVFGWESERYRNALFNQFPDVVQLVVSVTRAGLPVVEAFRGATTSLPVPSRDEFRRVMDEITIGQTPHIALLHLFERSGVGEYAVLAVLLAVQSRSGGRLVETIENVADMVRQRVAMRARARAMAAEARTSAKIMGVLPFVGAGILMTYRPDYLVPLISETRGIHLLGYAVLNMVLGILSIRWLIRWSVEE